MGFPKTCIGLAKRTFAILAIFVAGASACLGQLCSSTHVTDLYCLLPYTFHTSAAPFNAIFTPFGTELSQLPTARPAGYVHGTDGVVDKSFGSIFSERPESLGKHRFFAGFSYQNFTFNSIDGINLKQIPIVLYYAPQQVYTATSSRIDARVGQYAFVASWGITPTLDVSVEVPFERVTLAASIVGNEYGPGGVNAAVNEHVPGAASGLSDVVFGAKKSILYKKTNKLAAGLDFRIPTGDELNFLGSGTFGLRPYLSYSHQPEFPSGKTTGHRVTEYLNLGYQLNGDSILNASSTGAKQQLPTDLFYSGGASFEVRGRLTAFADIVGKHFFNTPRLAAPAPVAIPGVGNAMSVQPYVGDLTTTDLSAGMKYRTVANVVLSGNVTLKLDNEGLRTRAVPLIGVSRTF